MKRIYLFFGVLSAQLGFSQILVEKEVNTLIEAALNKDVEIFTNNLEKEKLQNEVRSVKAKYIPKVEANALYGYLNSEGSLDIPTIQLPITGAQLFAGSADFSTKGQAFHAGVTAKAILFSGGQIYNGTKALQSKADGTSYMMELRKDQVVRELLLDLDQLQMLNVAEALIQDSEKRLEKENERVEKAISQGLAIPYDRDKIKLATLELETRKQDVLNKKDLLALKIQQATGWSTEKVLKIQHNVDPILIFEDLNSNNRNELLALQSFDEAAEYAIKKEKGTFLPSIGAFGGYSYTSIFNSEIDIPLSNINRTANLKMNALTMNPTWMVGVAMKWELFSGFERKHKLETAQLNKKQIEAKRIDTEEKIVLQLEKTKKDYATSLKQLDIAKQREAIAKNNNEVASKQYRAGLISVTDRLSAENDIYKESLNKIETTIKQRQAAIDVYQASGSLLQYIKNN
ncbi:Outer membrane protein TolC [Paenimyroides ummariense]|uniref:Outer membrane protein TolC n=1 Tax=Paenimyroides ummariense TaxID=913024 RepID=A0A1I5DKA6_9FLAO|nr:TolC family protein [Paenimyroides ummariense]SFN99567.1 Outer membrane protein TolC [Paenimyroides ummariense]